MAEQREGADTDGSGTQGMASQESRPQQAGEAATTRVGMTDGDDTDGAGSGGMVRPSGTAAEGTGE